MPPAHLAHATMPRLGIANPFLHCAVAFVPVALLRDTIPPHGRGSLHYSLLPQVRV